MENQSLTRSKTQSDSLVATKDSPVVKKVMPLMNLPHDHDKAGFMEAIKRFNVTDEELEKGFWGAYADPYVPQTGIEFRHIFKWVQNNREEKVIDGGTW